MGSPHTLLAAACDVQGEECVTCEAGRRVIINELSSLHTFQTFCVLGAFVIQSAAANEAGEQAKHKQEVSTWTIMNNG